MLMGLARAPAGSVALWLNLETVATAVLARAFFHEHLGAPTWLSIVLIIAGSAILSAQGLSGLTAAMFVAAACVAWGLDNNLTSVITAYTPAQITFAKGVLGAAVNLTAGAFLDPRELLAWRSLAVGLVGALGYGASLVLYVASARELGATRAQLIFSTAPAWGLALSWLALKERVLGSQLIAAGLMSAALWLYNRERHAHLHAHEPALHRHWHHHDDGHHDHAHSPPVRGWHEHEHEHEAREHSHPHLPDLHHRHRH